MPFYAYAISEDSPISWRYLIIFATRDVADEWWRAIQTAAANNVKGWSTVSRVTPQLYTHKPGTKQIRESIVEKDVASKLSSKIFFQRLNDRDGRLVDIIPTQFTKDHISGKYFYIRSQRDPTLYWTVISNEHNGTVVLSRGDTPTAFVVELRVALAFQTPTVLTGSDDIVISVPTFQGRGGKNVSTDSAGGLILSEHHDIFKFGDLVDSFARQSYGSQLRIFKNDHNRGEVWELV